jgi:hypothetical protein
MMALGISLRTGITKDFIMRNVLCVVPIQNARHCYE